MHQNDYEFGRLFTKDDVSFSDILFYPLLTGEASSYFITSFSHYINSYDTWSLWNDFFHKMKMNIIYNKNLTIEVSIIKKCKFRFLWCCCLNVLHFCIFMFKIIIVSAWDSSSRHGWSLLCEFSLTSVSVFRCFIGNSFSWGYHCT